MKVNESKTYDLIDYYNLSCKEIKFTIDNWVKEISYESEYVGRGFFSTRYENVEKYYGVGQLRLMRNEVTYYFPKDCSQKSARHTNIYLEQNFVEYYRLRCIK